MQEIDNKGYICPQCKASYTPLDVDKIMDFARGIFVCEICAAELVENEDAESVQGSKDRMMRFNHQMRFNREGLQKSDAMKLPPFDVAAWVKQHAAAELEHRQKMNGSAGGVNGGVNGVGHGLKVAGANSTGGRDEGIGIMMVMDAEGEDEDKRRKEREREAEAKYKQNALPEWHLKSTITGDLTALGVKDQARAEAAARQNGGDESLKGLGIAGLRSSHQSTVTSSFIDLTSRSKVEDAASKADEDLYEKYYASLAASNGLATPASTSATPSIRIPSEHSYDNEEEEDRKPSIKYLESLTEYRKRSRPVDDVGSGGPRTPKLAKTDSDQSIANGSNTYANGAFNGSNGFLTPALPASAAMEETTAEPEPPEPAPTGPDPMVLGTYLLSNFGRVS